MLHVAWCRCPATRLVMIGDRYLTDMVYGNRHGMLTVRPSPLTLAGETLAVRMVSPACWRRVLVSPRTEVALGDY